MSEYWIYLIVNKVAKAVYVGQTTRLPSRRLAQHRQALRSGTHHNPILQAAWHKYGEDAFVFAVVKRCKTKRQLDACEIHAIAKLRRSTKFICYNIGDGGEPGSDPACIRLRTQKLKQYYATPEGMAARRVMSARAKALRRMRKKKSSFFYRLLRVLIDLVKMFTVWC